MWFDILAESADWVGDEGLVTIECGFNSFGECPLWNYSKVQEYDSSSILTILIKTNITLQQIEFTKLLGL